MKTAYEFNKELIQKVVPSFSYEGKNLLSWQKEAREKLINLMGLDKFSKVDADLDIEYEKSSKALPRSASPTLPKRATAYPVTYFYPTELKILPLS